MPPQVKSRRIGGRRRNRQSAATPAQEPARVIERESSVFRIQFVSRPWVLGALPRLGYALGRYGSGLGRVVELLQELAAFGAVGGLPALIRGVTQVIRFALGSLSHSSLGRAGRDIASGPACPGRVNQPRTLCTPIMLLIVGSMALLMLQACAPVVRMSPAPPAVWGNRAPGDIRTMGPDGRFEQVSIESIARRLQAGRAGAPYGILALSGGSAAGAFGAGALVGLTGSGTRPAFSVVTGVGADSLLAVYAFLGPDWDRQLADAWTTQRAGRLLQPRGLGVVFDSSIHRGRPLERWVDRHVSDEMLQAVAREAASGRLLLVTTTNVDTGETVIWDLGSIAMHGGAGAKALFSELLVASASVPGLLPPVIIRIQDDWGDYSEAHVDGTATLPFVVPPALLEPQPVVSRDSQPTVYVPAGVRTEFSSSSPR